MKIFYISGALLPSEISHSLSIMRVCQAFVDCGHEVLLSGRAAQGEDRDPVAFYGLRGGFRVIVNRLSRLTDNPVSRRLFLPGFALAWRTRREFASFKPEIVYSRLTLAELAFVPRDVPIVYEMHSLGPLRRSWRHRWLFFWLLRQKRFRRIVVTTDGLAEMLREEMAGVEIVVARLSAELPVAVSDEQLTEFRKAELSGGNFRSHVGYTGNLDTFGLRGTEIICAAAARMPDVAFHVVGGKQDAVEHWKRYAARVGATRNLFFYGHRNPSQMPYFLNCFDVVLAPLQSKKSAEAPTGMGMSPLKLPQYLSYGKPIVASDIPAHREILVHEKTALMVRASDVDAWVAAIRKLLADKGLCQRLGEEGRLAYERGFSPKVRVERILAGLTPPGAADLPEHRAAGR